MSARVVLLICMLISLIYNGIISLLSNIQRKKPLPKAVSDIYDKERYDTYLAYVSDEKKAEFIFSGISFVIDIALIFSPVYHQLEITAKKNPYGTTFLTLLMFLIIEIIVGTVSSYYTTFKIEERYGLNKKDIKEFVKDTVLENLTNIIVLSILMLIVVFLGENLGHLTNNYSIGPAASFFVSLSIALIIAAFVLGASLLSYFVLRKQYEFVPLEEGELKSAINRLQESSKKKVTIINVYNESKKSTSKNAFLLKLLWHREFGIADNFINENADKELLAVLSHEIGHLKHKKNLLNYLTYAFFVFMFFLLWYLICRPGVIFGINDWIRSSFSISSNNYYIIGVFYLEIIKPIAFLLKLFNSIRSRNEEREADMEAVMNGYANELITTFKRMSADELINVNPHPLVEFIEYDHPGMHNRITAIYEADNKRKQTKKPL